MVLERSPSLEARVLGRRLELLGLRGVKKLELHENRTVMVTLTERGVLRLHRGYFYAPDSVLRAVVDFVSPRVPRQRRLQAERELLAFPVGDFVPPRPRPSKDGKVRPGDLRLIRELEKLHRRLNREYFGGKLSAVRIRLSSRMRTRLGELTLDERTHRPVEIAISRRHLERDEWSEVEHTMLHEMVHQWQAESGLKVDHGPGFRRKALEVGVEPRARRFVRSRRRAARYG
jgi:hypothetical protein